MVVKEQPNEWRDKIAGRGREVCGELMELVLHGGGNKIEGGIGVSVGRLQAG